MFSLIFPLLGHLTLESLAELGWGSSFLQNTHVSLQKEQSQGSKLVWEKPKCLLSSTEVPQ